MPVEPMYRGFMFWPVGTGDSTTVWVDEETAVQVDLHHRADAEDDDTPYYPIIDELKELLPQVEGEPYLSVFILTHPDSDHCKGFSRLLDEVRIGEIWVSPRVFREYTKELCEDALAFRNEAIRRRDETIKVGGDPGAENRLRVIGWDELLSEEDWEGFPRDRMTIPGNPVEELDGKTYGGVFRAFIHAPFKEHAEQARNDTSLAMQATLQDGNGTGRVLLFGDLCYPVLRQIFDRTGDDENLRWDLLLAPHHCSKSVMYWKGEDDDEEKLRRDILDDFERTAEETGWVVASSEPIPSSDEPGQNPPHAKAKARYEEISPSGFLCTQEEPTEADPQVLRFPVTEEGISREEPSAKARVSAHGGWTGAVAAARGGNRPPAGEVGFGGR